MAENILNDPKAIRGLFELQGQGDRCIGDTPNYGLKEDYGINIDDPATRRAMTKALDGAGLSHYYSSEKQRIETGYASTTLYAYDKGRLQGLLDQNRDMLIKAEWPTQADRFINYLSHVEAPANTEIFDFIARCHGDDHNAWLRKNSYTATTAAEIEQQHVSVEEGRKKFRKLHPEFFRDDEVPAINNNGVVPPAEPAYQDPAAGAKNTNLYKLVAECRGGRCIESHALSQMSSFGSLNAVQKTENGYRFDLYQGRSIEWTAANKNDAIPHEAISGNKDDFGLFEACAIVTMARLHGWKEIHVQGNNDQKELLWLATQRQALHERDMQLSGMMPEGPLPQVANFKPAEDSEIYRKWLEEKAGWEAAHGGEKFEQTGSVRAPAAVKKEAQAPRKKAARSLDEKVNGHFNQMAGDPKKKTAAGHKRDAAPPPAVKKDQPGKSKSGDQRPGAR